MVGHAVTEVGWDSSEESREADRFERFRDEVAGRFGIGHVATPEPNGAFRSRIDAAFVGDMTFLEIAADPLAVERTPRDVAQSDPEIFTVGVVIEGQAVISQDGREATLGRSDLVLCESGRPFRIRFDRSFRQLLVHFRRSHLDERLLNADRVTAIRVDGGSGVAAVTATLLRSIYEQARVLGDGEPAVVERALDLIALTLGGGPAQPTGARAEQKLLARMHSFIETNLADPRLSPDVIAERHRISRRYLYRLFEAAGEPVFGHIRRRRLERCRAALADPLQSELTIWEIATRWGFTDASHFSRLFRQTFGVSPRGFRNGRRAKPTDPGGRR